MRFIVVFLIIQAHSYITEASEKNSSKPIDCALILAKDDNTEHARSSLLFGALLLPHENQILVEMTQKENWTEDEVDTAMRLTASGFSPDHIKRTIDAGRISPLITSGVMRDAFIETLNHEGHKDSTNIADFLNEISNGALVSTEVEMLVERVLDKLPKKIPERIISNALTNRELKKDYGMNTEQFNFLSDVVDNTNGETSEKLRNGIRALFFNTDPLFTQSVIASGSRWNRVKRILKTDVGALLFGQPNPPLDYKGGKLLSVHVKLGLLRSQTLTIRREVVESLLFSRDEDLIVVNDHVPKWGPSSRSFYSSRWSEVASDFVTKLGSLTYDEIKYIISYPYRCRYTFIDKSGSSHSYPQLHKSQLDPITLGFLTQVLRKGQIHPVLTHVQANDLLAFFKKKNERAILLNVLRQTYPEDAYYGRLIGQYE